VFSLSWSSRKVGGEGDPNEHCRRFGHEIFDVAKSDFERAAFLANVFDQRNRLRLRSDEASRGQDRDVCGKVSVRRMQFAAQVFDELANIVLDVGYQRI
jgi:hypothetical protein